MMMPPPQMTSGHVTPGGQLFNPYSQFEALKQIPFFQRDGPKWSQSQSQGHDAGVNWGQHNKTGGPSSRMINEHNHHSRKIPVRLSTAVIYNITYN